MDPYPYDEGDTRIFVASCLLFLLALALFGGAFLA